MFEKELEKLVVFVVVKLTVAPAHEEVTLELAEITGVFPNATFELAEVPVHPDLAIATV